MLEIQNLTKIHPPQKIALNDFTLTAGVGTLGLLGPNGAGKSSLMEILAANLDFEKGRVLLDGKINLKHSPQRWRRQLGYMPQSFDFPPHTTGREMLRESGYLMGIGGKAMKSRIVALLEAVNLSDAADRPAVDYSRGMKQRLALAMALLHEPRLLLLDEPTAGLDPIERVVFRELLRETAGKCIVLLSTHIVGDVERCCDKVAVVEKGRLLFHGSAGELSRRADGNTWELFVEADEVEPLAAQERIVSIKVEGQKARIRMLSDNAPTENAKAVAPTLEDGYLLLLERKQEEAPLQ